MAWDLHTSRISPYACAPLTDARVSRCAAGTRARRRFY